MSNCIYTFNDPLNGDKQITIEGLPALKAYLFKGGAEALLGNVAGELGIPVFGVIKQGVAKENSKSEIGKKPKLGNNVSIEIRSFSRFNSDEDKNEYVKSLINNGFNSDKLQKEVDNTAKASEYFSKGGDAGYAEATNYAATVGRDLLNRLIFAETQSAPSKYTQELKNTPQKLSPLHTAINNGNTTAVLEHIKANSATPLHQILADKLTGILPDGINITISDTLKNNRGESGIMNYDYASKTVSVNLSAIAKLKENTTEKAFIHELIHAVTGEKINAIMSKNESTLTKDEKIARTQLKLIANLIAKHVEKNSITGDLKKISALTSENLRELITYGLTEPAFQKMLADIKIGKDKTAWTQFVHAVAKLLGIELNEEQETALSALLMVGDSLLGDALANMENNDAIEPSRTDILAKIKLANKEMLSLVNRLKNGESAKSLNYSEKLKEFEAEKDRLAILYDNSIDNEQKNYPNGITQELIDEVKTHLSDKVHNGWNGDFLPKVRVTKGLIYSITLDEEKTEQIYQILKNEQDTLESIDQERSIFKNIVPKKRQNVWEEDKPYRESGASHFDISGTQRALMSGRAKDKFDKEVAKGTDNKRSLATGWYDKLIRAYENEEFSLETKGLSLDARNYIARHIADLKAEGEDSATNESQPANTEESAQLVAPKNKISKSARQNLYVALLRAGFKERYGSATPIGNLLINGESYSDTNILKNSDLKQNFTIQTIKDGKVGRIELTPHQLVKAAKSAGNPVFDKVDGIDSIKPSKSTTPTNAHTKTTLTSALRTVMDREYGSGWTQRLLATGKFEVMTRAEAQALEPTANLDNVQGYYSAKHDKTILIAEQIAKGKDLKGLMLHEIGVHAQNLNLEQKEFNEILNQLERMRKFSKPVQAAYIRALNSFSLSSMPIDSVPQTSIRNAYSSSDISNAKTAINKLINNIEIIIGSGVRRGISTNNVKNPSNRAWVAIKNLSNLSVLETRLNKNLGFVGINKARIMVSSMRDIVSNDEIFNSIIEFIPIDMMNMLINGKLSANGHLYDMSMLIDSLPVNTDNSISSFSDIPIRIAMNVFNSAISGAANNPLEFSKSSGIDMKDISALNARLAGVNSVVGTKESSGARLTAKNISGFYAARLSNYIDTAISALENNGFISKDTSARIRTKEQSRFTNSNLGVGSSENGIAGGTIDNRHDVTPNSNVMSGDKPVEADLSPTIISKKDVMHEVLAYLVEYHPKLSINQKFLAWFKSKLRALGKALPKLEQLKWVRWANSLNEQDLVSVASSALRNAPNDLMFDNVGRGDEVVKLSEQQARFYSALRKAFLLAPEKVFTNGAAVKAWINGNAGKFEVKKDEIYWSGLNEFLDMQGKVSRDDVVRFLDTNGVKVDTIELNGIPVYPKGSYMDDDGDVRQQEEWRVTNEGDELSDDELDDLLSEMTDVSGNYVEGEGGNAINSDDWLKQEGGENYRELIVTAPQAESYNENDRMHYGEISDGQAIVWSRLTDRETNNGEKILFVEEIQSQRADDYRAKYKGKPLIENNYRDEKYLDDSEKIPEAPFISSSSKTPSTAYITLILKKIVSSAIDNNQSIVAWATAEQMPSSENVESWGNAMYGNQYGLDEKENPALITLVAREIARKFGGKIGTVNLSTGTQPALIITPEMRQKVINEGMPLFSKAQPKDNDLQSKITDAIDAEWLNIVNEMKRQGVIKIRC